MNVSATRRIAVARAICTASKENPDHAGDAGGNQYRWQDYLEIADAAISAMSEPGMPAFTKDGIEVRVGQVWKDLDKRMQDRHCKVIAVQDGRAQMNRCTPSGKVVTDTVTKIATSRMHKGSTGWVLVSGT